MTGRPRTGNVRYRAGAWRLQASIGADPSGRRRYRTKTVPGPNTKAGEAVARQVLARLLLEVDAGLHPATERGSFAELVDRWIEARSHDWPDGAAKHTRQVLTRHVLPTLGPVQVDRIRPIDVEHLYASLRRTLAPATVRRIHNMVRAALGQAVRWQLIATNPAAAVDPPRVPKQAPHRIPDAAAVRDAIAAAPPDVAALLRLAVHTGARRGELVNLRWRDVDLDGGVVVFHQTKTDTYKTVAIGPRSRAVLEAHRRHVAEQALRVGVPMPEWVFPSWRKPGRPLVASSVTHQWIRLRDAAGLDGVRLHDLRHTVATHLIASGTDVRTVAGRLGHSTPSVTLSVYAHRVDARDRAAAEAMDDWLDAV